MQYLRLLQSNVRDNPPQAALVAKLTAELERRGEQLGDAALSANYNQTIAAISKYNAVGHDPALIRIDRLLTQLIRDERALLAQRNRIAAGDRASLNQAILLFSLLGAAAAVIARSEEHTSELQSLMRISYAVFCLKKKKTTNHTD